MDSSLKKACLDADEQLGELAKTAEKIGKAAGGRRSDNGGHRRGGRSLRESLTEHQQAANSMAAATGAAGEQLEYLQDAMDTVYTDNYGESSARCGGRRVPGGPQHENISPDEIVEATEAALAPPGHFRVWRGGEVRAAAAIQKNFGGSAKEAFSLIAAGAQNGLDYRGTDRHHQRIFQPVLQAGIYGRR